MDSAYVGRNGEPLGGAIGYDSVAVLVDGIGVSDELEPGGVGAAVELPLVLDVERESVVLPCSRVDRRGVTSAIARVITYINSLNKKDESACFHRCFGDSMRRRTDCHSGARKAVTDLEIGVFGGGDDVVPWTCLCLPHGGTLYRGRPGNLLGIR